jgi:hypothetical protein
MFFIKLVLCAGLITGYIYGFDLAYSSIPVTKQAQASLILLKLVETGTFSTLQDGYIWTDRAVFWQFGERYHGIVFRTEPPLDMSMLRDSGLLVSVLIAAGLVFILA